MTFYCFISELTHQCIKHLRSVIAIKNGHKDGKFAKECFVMNRVEFHFVGGEPHHVEFNGIDLGQFEVKIEKSIADGKHFMFVNEKKFVAGLAANRRVILATLESFDGCTGGASSQAYRIETDGHGKEHRLFLEDHSYEY